MNTHKNKQLTSKHNMQVIFLTNSSKLFKVVLKKIQRPSNHTVKVITTLTSLLISNFCNSNLHIPSTNTNENPLKEECGLFRLIVMAIPYYENFLYFQSDINFFWAP